MSDNNKMPELFSDEYIKEVVDSIYEKCKSQDCENCYFHNEIAEELCQVDVILELYRKWQNAKKGL